MSIAVLNEFSGWNRLRALTPLLQKAAKAALKAAGRSGDVTILLSDDAKLKALNAAFRGKRKPTNVLSFPADGGDAGYLGDIALAYESCAREAKAQNKRVRDHACHLTVHGVLHLVGHDHMTPAQGDAMEALETVILAKLGIEDPYR